MIVIDTHILVWWANDDKALSPSARKTLNKELAEDEQIIISSISVWEISMLINKGRLVLNTDLERWLDNVAGIDGIRFWPIDNEIAMKSTQLPGEFHKDPADRMIVATARELACPLVTADEKIIDYKHVETMW